MSESFDVVLMDTNLNLGNYAPIELGYLQAYLEQPKVGLSTYVFNSGRRRLDDAGISEVVDDLTRKNPSIIGISAIDHYLDEALAVSKAIKDKDKDIFVVMGGYGPTFQSERCLNNGTCDLIVSGEGEHTVGEVFPKIVAGDYESIYKAKGISYKKDGKVFSNPDREPIMDLDSLPFPERRDLPPSKYHIGPNGKPFQQIPLVSSRGCHWAKCNFCIGAKFPGTETYRLRSKENVMEELKEVNDKYGLGIIQDYSPCFFGKDPKRTKYFLEESKKNFSDTYFIGQIRPEDVLRSREVLAEHVKQFYGLAVGLENFSDAWLKRNNKGVTSKTNQMAVKVLQELSEKRGTDEGTLPGFYVPMTIDCDMKTTFSEFKEHYEIIKKIGMINYWMPGSLNHYPYIDEKQQEKIWLTADPEARVLRANIDRVSGNPFIMIVPSWIKKGKIDERGEKLRVFFDRLVEPYQTLFEAYGSFR